ncbi:MAG: cbb3-type cytochrome oxidase assembly protein CcoS [Gammaproteobacteria bacterium]|nr:cbb3-type cytochrome oxidase assembly protein CcoS [Gammaproteobacteria bacterium]MDH4253135.1 cbb3-type cytochrome oxidase assembly protein CcoS [Gammaproteobacteria bacterium]MDH5308503.1 cbb3-type cytochrome oxidase assembly protein CcoS [Gammaproteobacteria bacterium]
MTILYLLIPLGLLLLAIGVAAFFWATRSGQFDDLDSPAWSVVLDDDRSPGKRRRDARADPRSGGPDDEEPPP